MKVVNFIQKHKIFFILLLSLITLAIGLCFVANERKPVENINTDSSTYGKVSFYYEYTAYHSNKTTASEAWNNKRTGYAYENSEGIELYPTFQLIADNSGTNGDWYCIKNAETSNSSTAAWDVLVGTVGKATYTSTVSMFSKKDFSFSFSLTPSYDSTLFYCDTNGTETSFSESGTVSWGTADNYIKSFSYECIFYPKQVWVYFYASLATFASASTGIFSSGNNVEITTVTAYEHYADPPESPTRTGYTFGGWKDSNGGSFSTSSYLETGSATAYFAQWTANSYDVVYNANGGVFSSGATTKTVSSTYDGTYVLPENPTRNGYEFLGWYSGDTQIDSSTKFQQTAQTTVYAHWKRITFDLQFKANDGTEGLTSTPATIGQAYPVITSTVGWKPSRTGYTFNGFYTASSGGEQIYNADGNVVVSYTFAMTEAEIAQGYKTLYAQWTEHTYYIAFDANGGSGSMSTMTMKYTDTKSLTANAFKPPTGYLFGGWATSASGSAVYSDGQAVSQLSAGNGATVTLYASWTPISYTVIYNANGGTGTMSNATATYDSSFTLRANTFICANKLFIGWATSASGGVTYKDQATITTNLASTQGATVNLYAVWLDTWANHGTTPRGSGTSGSPYLISTPANLGWIASQVNNSSTNSSMIGKYFKQTRNINLNQYTWMPIGNTINKFIGTYDGNGYAITNLNTSSATKANGNYLHSYSGLFGYVTKKDSVTKTTLKNINILSGNIYGHEQTAILVGRSEHATITGCNVYGSVYGCVWIGAISGSPVYDTISNCYSKTQISVTGGVAGMFGRAYASKISSCGFEGTSNNRLLIGGAEYGVTVTDCFANSASRVEFVPGSATITNCLYIANNTSSSPTKKYYPDPMAESDSNDETNSFANWIIPPWVESTTADRTPLPSGLSWLATGGEKVTGLSQITALGYSAA